METKKSGFNIPRLVVLVVAILMTLDGIWRASTPMLIASNVLILLSLVSACIYFGFGAKKNAAPYYKGFLVIFAISQFIRVLFLPNMMDMVSELLNVSIDDKMSMNTTVIPVPMLIDLIIFAVLCTLILANDLGKRKSMIFSYITIAMSAVLLIISIVGIVRLHSDGMLMITTTGTRFVLCFALLLMVDGKYKDKAERNTK